MAANCKSDDTFCIIFLAVQTHVTLIHIPTQKT